MKRFTETNKWDDPWFQQLSPEHKCCWMYLCDRCDAAGVIDLNEGLSSYMIGGGVSWQDL